MNLFGAKQHDPDFCQCQVSGSALAAMRKVPVARRWLGSPLPDLSFVEANLDRLLELRTAARTANLPPTAAAARLLSLLGPDRELPMSLVYQRPELFRPALLPAPGNDAGVAPWT